MPEKPRSPRPRSTAHSLCAVRLRRAAYLTGDAPAKGTGRHGSAVGGRSAPPLDPTAPPRPAPPAEGRFIPCKWGGAAKPPPVAKRRALRSRTARAPRVSAGCRRPSSWRRPSVHLSVSAGLARWARAPSPRWGWEEWRCFPAGRTPTAEGNARAEGGWGEPGCGAAVSALVLPVVVGRWSRSAFLSCFPLSCDVQREPSVWKSPCSHQARI